MLEQTRLSEAPEMREAAPSPRGAAPGRRTRSRVLMRGVLLETEGASERELEFGSSQEDFLLPRKRRSAFLAGLLGRPSTALVACVVVLGAVAALLTTRRLASQAIRSGVSLVLGDLPSQQDGGCSARLSQRALEGQAFVHMSAENASIMVQDHMLILEPGTPLEELHRIERVYVETGTLRLYNGLQFSHQQGATLASLPPTADVLAEHDATDTAQFARLTRRVQSASAAGGNVVTLREGCRDFHVGDEIELSSEDGHYEMNMITSIKTSGGDTCELHLAYPFYFEHSGTSSVSRMVHKHALLLHTSAPTPAPTPEGTAPVSAPALAPELRAPAASFVVGHVDFAALGSPDIERLQGACQEKVAAAAGVDAAQVAVVLAQGSVLVDVFIDSDRQADLEALREAVQGSFESDAGVKACCVTGEITISSAASEELVAREGSSEKASAHGPSTAVVVSAIVIGFSVIGIVLFTLGNTSRGEGYRTSFDPRWVQNPPDVIVIPGGGISRDGSLVPWVQGRLRRAKEIYDEVNEVKRQQQVTSTTYLVTMCEGIRYSPRDPRGNRAKRLESQLSAEFLRKAGVKASDIIADDLSLDTMGNAYFLRANQTEIYFARSLVVVTNEFHMARTKAIFLKVFGLQPFPDNNSKYTLVFEQVNNTSIEQAGLKKRSDWEEQQLFDFERLSADWSSLHDLHAFIFSSPGGDREALLSPRIQASKPPRSDSQGPTP